MDRYFRINFVQIEQRVSTEQEFKTREFTTMVQLSVATNVFRLEDHEKAFYNFNIISNVHPNKIHRSKDSGQAKKAKATASKLNFAYRQMTNP